MMPSSSPLISATSSGLTPRSARPRADGGGVRRIDADLIGPQRGQRLDHARRAAAGVLVLVQPQAVVELGLRYCALTHSRRGPTPGACRRLRSGSGWALTARGRLCGVGVVWPPAHLPYLGHPPARSIRRALEALGASQRDDRRREPLQALLRSRAAPTSRGRSRRRSGRRGSAPRRRSAARGSIRSRSRRRPAPCTGRRTPRPRRAASAPGLRDRRPDARAPAVGELHRRLRARHDDDGAVARERLASTMSRPLRPFDHGGATRAASRRLQRDEDRAGVGIVLGLGDEIGGDPVGGPDAGDDHDLGRAGVEVDGAVGRRRAPSRRRRSGCRARRSCRRAEPWPVPYASAAIACAPPTRKSRVTPASSAAAITTGSGRGQTAMISRTPATRAGMAVISSEEGSGKRPPGT